MEGDTISMQEIFTFQRDGVEDGRIVGHVASTGIRPHFAEQLKASSHHVDPAVFDYLKGVTIMFAALALLIFGSLVLAGYALAGMLTAREGERESLRRRLTTMVGTSTSERRGALLKDQRLSTIGVGEQHAGAAEPGATAHPPHDPRGSQEAGWRDPALRAAGGRRRLPDRGHRHGAARARTAGGSGRRADPARAREAHGSQACRRVRGPAAGRARPGACGAPGWPRSHARDERGGRRVPRPGRAGVPRRGRGGPPGPPAARGPRQPGRARRQRRHATPPGGHPHRPGRRRQPGRGPRQGELHHPGALQAAA